MLRELRNFIKFSNGEVGSSIKDNHVLLSDIRSIEQELGHRLIRNAGNEGIVLTEFGAAFATYAKKCLSVIREGINVSSECNIYDSDNQLVLGISKDSASTWAINCVKDFNKMHPGLRLTLLAEDELTEKMTDNATIIFWCIDHDLENYDKLWYIEYKYGLYASEEYIRTNGVPTLGNIKKHKIISYSGNDNNAELTNWHLHGKYGLPILRPDISSKSRDFIVKITAEGAGIGAICDRQDVYYGYSHLNRVLKMINGPVLKSYFVAKKGVNEQMRCNVDLMSSLFRKYFSERGIKVFDCPR